MSSTDPASVPICTTGGAGVETTGGYKVCVGTPGSGFGSAAVPTTPTVDNHNDTAAAASYMQFYNVQQDVTATNSSTNPGITQGTPDAKTGVLAIKNPPIATANGCEMPALWNPSSGPTTLPNNATRATRLLPFTTASSVGGNNDGGMSRGGVPADLMAMNKCWGLSKGSWMHGGVSAGNVGQWRAPAGKGFLVKLPNGKQWRQSTMLWTRLTGDNYTAALDPHGDVCVAPNGMTKTHIGVEDSVDKTNSNCGCDVTTMANAANDDNGTAWSRTYLFPTQANCGDDEVATPLPQDYSQTNDPLAKTPTPNGYTNPKGRVGGCFVSRDMYGPGKFTVLANLPPTAPASDPTGRLTLASTTSGAPLRIDPTTGEYPSKAAGAVPYGRGYVFAMWTFNYTEAYQTASKCISDGASTAVQPYSAGMMAAGSAVASPANVNGNAANCINQCSLPGDGGSLKEGWTMDPATPCATANTASTSTCGAPCISDQIPKGSKVCTAGNCGCGLTPGAYKSLVYSPTYNGNNAGLKNVVVTYPNLGGTVVGDGYGGSMTSHNHEIDIEIPSNSAPLQGPDMTKTLGADSANFNTWVTDTQTYNLGATAYYQQAQCLAPPGQYFMAVGPDDDDNTFHEYSFVWYVDPTPGSNGSYVAFFRDGVELFRTHRYVPRRSGRLVVGVWPAWWGSNYAPLTFNQVYVKIARLEIVPQADYNNATFVPRALVTNGAQVYDQEYPPYWYAAKGSCKTDAKGNYSCEYVRVPGGTITCGIADPAARAAVTVSPSGGGMAWWVWLLIAIAVAVVITGVVLGSLYGAKKWDPTHAAAAKKAPTSAAPARTGGRYYRGGTTTRRPMYRWD